MAAGCGGSTSSGNGPSPTDLVEPGSSKDFVAVACDGEDETVTDLSSVAGELGYDELVLVSGDQMNESRKANFRTRARTPLACQDDACSSFVKSVVEKSITSAESESDDDEETRVWSFPTRGNTIVGALIARRGDTFTSVTTTAELRTFIGPLDTGWKAHLFVLATAHEHHFDVRCQAYMPSGESKQSYVRVVGPIQILGVREAEDCTTKAETGRVLLAVDGNGVSSVVSSSSLWKGATDCD